MFDKIKEKLGIKEKVTLDDLIDKQLDWVGYLQNDTDPKKFREAVKDLDSLYRIKISIKSVNKGAEVHLDPNTVLVVLGAIGEVLLIINHEQTGAIVSKAFSRVIRPRL